MGGGGVVLLLTSQHLHLHHLPATLEKKSAFISGNSSAPSTGSVASVEEDCKDLPMPIFFCPKVSFSKVIVYFYINKICKGTPCRIFL